MTSNNTSQAGRSKAFSLSTDDSTSREEDRSLRLRWKDEIRRYALSLGFSSVGFADASSFTDEARYLQKLQAEGRRVPFAETDHELRSEPERWLPDARTIIACALPYRSRHLGRRPVLRRSLRPQGMPPKGRFSCYAFGQDYHLLLRERLETLGEALVGITGKEIQYRVFVDTGPALDRAVARRAGLGNIGKNTMLITPEAGSWVFLGEVVIDLELPPDVVDITVETDFCADCDLCQRACPTDALKDPYQLDFDRCLGYVTQMPGSIPEEFRRPLGQWVWGCDICQEVCPHNRVLQASDASADFEDGLEHDKHDKNEAWLPSPIDPDSAFAPDPDLVQPDLEWLAGLGKGAFRRAYGKSAAAWRGRIPLQRNALVALGNSGQPEALPALAAGLRAERPILREHAAWGLGRLAERSPSLAERVSVLLEEAAQSEEDETVRREIAAAQSTIRRLLTAESVEALEE